MQRAVDMCATTLKPCEPTKERVLESLVNERSPSIVLHHPMLNAQTLTPCPPVLFLDVDGVTPPLHIPTLSLPPRPAPPACIRNLPAPKNT